MKISTFYQAIAGIVFSYIIIDDIFILSYIFALRMKKIKTFLFLNKYCWVRKMFNIAIAFLVAVFYIYRIIIYGATFIRLFMLGFSLTGGIVEAGRLYNKLFEPGTLTMRVELDYTKAPDNIKIQTAIKLTKMKEDGRTVAAAQA